MRLQNIGGAHYMPGIFIFSFLTLTTTLKVGICILILCLRELRIINGPRMHSSLIKDLRFGHISVWKP